jgi:UDP:flavonoid glycosyltransferase YjiC (YdhE family)
MNRAPRILLVSIGEPGHAFPIIAIAAKLAAAGCETAVHTWFRWEQQIETVGARFFRAPKFAVNPGEQPPNVHEAAALATDELKAVIEQWEPDVIVGDVLTLASSLAAERCGVPFITFVPHFWHATGEDSVPFGSGWSPAESVVARQVFRLMHRFERVGLEYGRDELNETRAAVGLPAIERTHGALSQELVLVGTLPQLEPTRDWPANVEVVGPVMWETPTDPIDFQPDGRPLVVVAPSTAQDLTHTMLDAAVRGLGELPVQVVAAKNGREPPRPLEPAANTTIVDWAPYGQLFPIADVVVCHGGHGTIMRALTSGAAVVITPASGDQYENAARVRWAKVGVSVPNRFISPRTISAAVEKVLHRPSYGRQVASLAEWASRHDAAQSAAERIITFAQGREAGTFPGRIPR